MIVIFDEGDGTKQYPTPRQMSEVPAWSQECVRKADLVLSVEREPDLLFHVLKNRLGPVAALDEDRFYELLADVLHARGGV